MGSIEQLKTLLEGARIVSVGESKNPESICNFSIELGDELTSFTLYATDLGYWAGDVVKNGKLNSIADLFDSVYNHVYGCQKIIRHVGESDSIGYFECACGQAFIVLEKNIDGDYRDILKDDETMKKVASLLSENIFIGSAKDLLYELGEEIDDES